MMQRPNVKWEQIPNGIISKSTHSFKATHSLSSKLNWVREMLNQAKDSSQVIPDIITRSSSLINSHRKVPYLSKQWGKENNACTNLNLTQKLRRNEGNIKRKMRTLEPAECSQDSTSQSQYQHSRKYSCQLTKARARLQDRVNGSYFRKPVHSRTRNEIKLAFGRDKGFKLDPWINESEDNQEDLFAKYRC